VYPEAEFPPLPRRILPLERAGAALECLLCSGFPTQVLLIILLTGFGFSIQGAAGGLNPRFLFTLSLLDAAIVIGLTVFFLKAHGESVRDVLIGPRRVFREVLFGIALIPLVFAIVIVVLSLVLTYAPWLHNVPRNPLEDMLGSRLDAAIFAVVVMIAGGVREEVQRGFIVHRFGQYLGGGGTGVAIHSVLFGLGHYEQGYDAAIATGLLGLFWGVIYLRRGSIVAPVVSHAAFNLAQILKFLALR
jgi:membrane protease YdiL (CAAX protease family)